MKQFFWAIFAIVIVTYAPWACADEKPQPYPDIESIPAPLLEQMRYGVVYEEQYVANVLQQIRQAARDHKSLTQQDVDDAKQRAVDARRRQQFQQVVRYDLNRDGQVTSEEVRRVYLQEREERGENAQGCEDEANRFIKTYDVDGDGIISLAEMSALPANQRENYQQNGNIEALLELDPNHDGKLTVEELEILARNAFATIDTDGNGVASPDELQALSARRQNGDGMGGYDSFHRHLESMRTACSAPTAAAGETVVLLDISHGDTVADHTVAGQDTVTTSARIRIADGAGQLYIIAVAATPVIWQVQGNASRVSHLILIGPLSRTGKTMAGATGVDPGKVSFVHGRGCMPLNSYEASSTEWLQAKADAKSLTGKEAQQSISADTGSIFNVSSGSAALEAANRETKAPEGYDTETWNRLLVSEPGGIATFGDTKIVSDASAEAYQVLPREAGLANLIAQGKLKREQAPSGERFWIVKDILRYPGDLSGAHTVRFVLAKGVKLPAGELNHSCVISGETGEYLAGNPADCAH